MDFMATLLGCGPVWTALRFGSRPDPPTESAIPPPREDLPAQRERRPLRRAVHERHGQPHSCPDGADIVTAIRSAAAGQAVFGAALAGRLSRWLAGRPAPPAEVPFPQLTDRERAILDGVAAGLTNAQIGQRLYLSAKTVANNVSTILTKLQVTERGQAIVRAREAGLGRTD
jgi:DNA-binding CsgD family transcriptional regulator